jgi:tRNA pseudouridine13 synthase
MLARFAGVRQRDVSYAGIKDRHAKTTQWFSVWMPGKDDPDWDKLETETVKVCQATRHARKLKRGVLSGNYFQITIRQWDGNREVIENQLLQIKEQGFPNYFGVQRFGRQGNNVTKALAMFQGEKVKREQRSIYLSAVRSYFFNQLLAKRISLGSWNQAVSGDVCIFDCSNSFFTTDQIDDSITQRVKTGEIHPAGLLFGQQDSETKKEAWNIEQDIFHTNLPLTQGLIEQGVASGRRAFRVFPTKFEWEFLPEMKVILKFSLPAGSYATSLLRELVVI